ncbi:MAG: hypothetical protein H6Q18_1114 [Bacteroidetes bacterium]|nr:hypothetical protein [Bacteroidota bacterium]
MKKLILFLFYILCMSASTYAQTITISNGPGEEKKPCTSTVKNIVDTCKLQIQYQMTSIKDVKNPEKKTNNFMLLQIGNHLSKFSDYFKLKFDSLETVYAQQKMDEVEAMNKLMPIMRGTVSLNVMKDYPAGKISTYDRIPTSGSFYYEEDKISQQWNLVEQKDTIICGYPCKYATTTFRGRNYTAWYAPEISISDGPWKFWGLPGLILKISDNNQITPLQPHRA